MSGSLRPTPPRNQQIAIERHLMGDEWSEVRGLWWLGVVCLGALLLSVAALPWVAVPMGLLGLFAMVAGTGLYPGRSSFRRSRSDWERELQWRREAELRVLDRQEGSELVRTVELKGRPLWEERAPLASAPEAALAQAARWRVESHSRERQLRAGQEPTPAEPTPPRLGAEQERLLAALLQAEPALPHTPAVEARPEYTRRHGLPEHALSRSARAIGAD
jgi:hypothetical protein